MPVMGALSEAIKIGNNFTPMVPAPGVAAIKVLSQMMVAGPSIQVFGIVAIPVMPLGAGAALVLSLLEYIINKMIEDISKQQKKAMDDYNRELRKAHKAREAAIAKLYKDEVAAQKIIIKEFDTLTQRATDIPKEQDTLAKDQATEKTAYQAQLFQYSQKLFQAKLANDQPQQDYWKDQIALLEPWLIKILQMTVDIILLGLELKQVQRRLVVITPLATIQIEKSWLWLNKWADDFEVPIPYYPDLPSAPRLPNKFPTLPDNCLIDKGRQVFAKWLVTPTLLPFGIPVATLFECIRAYLAPLDPANAAKLESMPDAILFQLGMAI
jgi:hypothetical protein